MNMVDSKTRKRRRSPRQKLSTGEWVPIEDAFLALRLQIKFREDREAWTRYVSPAVRAATAHDGKWVRHEGPYVVADAEGRIKVVKARDEVCSKGAVSRDDLDYVLANVPFLFDSLGATALKVCTRNVYAFVNRRNWPAERISTQFHVDGDAHGTNKGSREVPEPSMADSEAKSRVAGVMLDNAATLHLLDPAIVNRDWRAITRERAWQPVFADRVWKSSISKRKWKMVFAAGDGKSITARPGWRVITGIRARASIATAAAPVVSVLGKAWTIEATGWRAKVAPPLLFRDPTQLPPEMRDRQWIDSYVQAWKRLEKLGRSGLVADLTDRLSKKELITIEGRFIPTAYRLLSDIGVSAAPAGEGRWDGPAGLILALESIANRRLAFLRAQLRGALSTYDLKAEGCIVCGYPIPGEGERGSPLTVCGTSACKKKSPQNEAVRKSRSRDHERRRNLP